MSKVLNFEGIDSPTLNFEGIDESVVEQQKELREEAARKEQKRKYPTGEERGGAPGSIVEPVEPWSIYNVGKGVLEGLNPLNFIHPFSRPIETAEELGRTREHSETEAGKAWAEGDYPYAISRGILNMIPTGPGIAGLAEKAGTQPAEAAGTAAGLVAAPRVYGLAGRGASDAAGSTEAAFRGLIDKVGRELPEDATALSYPGAVGRAVRGAGIDVLSGKYKPHMQLLKALRPRNTITNADQFLEGVMPEVNAGSKLTGKFTNNIESLDENLDAQFKARREEYKNLKQGDFTVNGKSVADAIWNSITDLDKTKMGPEMASSTRKAIYDTWDRYFTSDQFSKFLENSNASKSVQGYFNKLPGQQYVLDRQSDMGSAMAENHAIRSAFYDGLEKSMGAGEAAKSVGKALQNIIQTKDFIDRRWNVEQRSAMQNLPQSISKLAAGGLYLEAANQLASGNVGGALGLAASGLSEQAIANFLREFNSTNGQIASAFRRSGGVLPKSTPVPNIVATKVAAERRALPSSTGRVEPQTTGSASPGSLYAQYQWQRPGAFALPEETPRPEPTGVMRDILSPNREDILRRMSAGALPGRILGETKPLKPGKGPIILGGAGSSGDFANGPGLPTTPWPVEPIVKRAMKDIQRLAKGRFGKVWFGTSEE